MKKHKTNNHPQRRREQSHENIAPLLEKMLQFLKVRKGQTISFTEMVKQFQSKTTEQIERKKRQDNRSKYKAEIPEKGSSVANFIFEILSDFSDYGLVKLDRNNIHISQTFAVKGRFSVSKKGGAYLMGEHSQDVFIPPQDRNGASHRDLVLAELTDKFRGRWNGRVVKVLEKFTSRHMLKVVRFVHGGGFACAVTDSPDSEHAFLDTKEQLLPGAFVFAEQTRETAEVFIDRQAGGRQLQRVGKYLLLEVLDPESLHADIERIAARFSLPGAFPENAIPDKKNLEKITKAELKNKKRRNLRKMYSCTIDGADAKDFDDAISLEKTKTGYILYVHIADVSFYVGRNSDLELEALKRGNSYYLTTKVIPMLPEILSENFCSLRPKTTRLAVTAEMHYDKKGDLKKTEFYRSVIYLRERLTYENAEKQIDKKKSRMAQFWELANTLLTRRFGNGKIDLNLAEIKPITDGKGGLAGIEERERLRSHRLIEEFMLSANNAVAEFARKNNIPLLHRAHDAILPEKLEKINSFLKLFGVPLQLRNLTYPEIQKAINAVKGIASERIFHYLLLRSFTQAYYTPEIHGHWGLAFEDYLHFTSPIRRFADLVVHRQLNSFLEKRPFEYLPSDLIFLGKETSRLERLAMEAERAQLKLLSVRFLKIREGETFEAFLTSFNTEGLFIQINDPPVEGFIPALEFGRSSEVRAMGDFQVYLPKYHIVATSGTKLMVKLKKADWEKMQLVFSIQKIMK